MTKIKTFGVIALFACAMIAPQKAEAKKIEFAYVFSNGCIGTHTYHSTFFGLFQWETFEVIACPPGVAAPQI